MQAHHGPFKPWQHQEKQRRCLPTARDPAQSQENMSASVPTPSRTTVSSVDRLRSLPVLFRKADLTTRFRWDPSTASSYLQRWKQRQFVAALGHRSNVFANLVVDSDPIWEAALLMARPSAIVVGVEVLRRAGWTTQVPRRYDIAIDDSLPPFRSDYFFLERRSDDWFARVKRGRGARAMTSARTAPEYRWAPSLRPAWALADMLVTWGWGRCGLHPDDLYFDEVTDRDHSDWRRASRALGVPRGTVPELEGEQ